MIKLKGGKIYEYSDDQFKEKNIDILASGSGYQDTNLSIFC
jgi:hypothetical protein